MDHRLQFLESVAATGSAGGRYKVCGYERMAPEVSFTHSLPVWESTGVAEYHLPDGRLVDVTRDGQMRIAGSNIVLERADGSSDALLR